MKFLFKYFVFLFLFGTGVLRAQNYPVQALVSVTPPYSSYLPDYADPFNNQMRIILTLTDFNVSQYDVKLRLTIGELSGYVITTTPDLSALPAFTLEPGVPFQISGSDLAPYLSSDNLVFTGLSKDQYNATKMLPEGFANVCVEVIAAGPSQAVLSSKSCGMYNFAKYDPPLLNFPDCGTEFSPNQTQTIAFSWTPMHMHSPNGASTSYVLEIFEMQVPGTDHNQLATTTEPIFTFPKAWEPPNTFPSKTLNLNDLQFQVGYTYVWRVKAIDPSGRDLYHNDGYSQVCSFVWGNAADQLLDGVTLELESSGTGETVGSAWWNGSSIFDSYELEVRKTGNPNYNWFKYQTSDVEDKMYQLEPETEYECRVKGLAGGAETEWSNISVFTTPSPREYECGESNVPGTPGIFQPLDFMLPGMKVQTGQFTMDVILAEAIPGNPGHFKGTGKIPITFLATANVEFDDILVDENLIHHGGRINVMTDDVEAWIDSYDNVYIEGVITEYQSNASDSTITFYLADGSHQQFDWPPAGETTAYIDENGFIYTVDEKGNVTVSQITTADNDNLDATADHQINFIEHPGQHYGFDRLKYLEWTRYYPVIGLSDGTDYFVSYKSIRYNQADKMYAVVKSNNSFTPTFVTASGVQLQAQMLEDTLYEITISPFATSQIIYAYDDQNGKIGKTNLSVYSNETVEVVIIPVNDAVPVDTQTLSDTINAIFSQAVSSFTIVQDENFYYSFDLDGNGLDGASDTSLSLYSEEMKKLRDEYFKTHSKGNKYYLFVVPEIAGIYEGYMVRGRIVGFLDKNAGARTYAHELGHGAFGLRHTFPEVELKGTNNILDYSAGSHLTHRQWYQMHHFTPSWSFGDNVEDGGLATAENLEFLDSYRNKDGYFCVLTPSGKPLVLPKDVQSIDFVTTYDRMRSGVEIPLGSIAGFKDGNKSYIALRGVSSGNFLGYGIRTGENTFKFYEDSLTRLYNYQDTSDALYTKVISGTPCFVGGAFTYKVYRTSYFDNGSNVPTDYSTSYRGAGPFGGLLDFATYLDETQSPIELPVKFNFEGGSDFTTIDQYFFAEFGYGDICGEEAMYAFAAAQALYENPQNLICVSDLANYVYEGFNVQQWQSKVYLDNLGDMESLFLLGDMLQGNAYDQFKATGSSQLEPNFFKYLLFVFNRMSNEITLTQQNPNTLANTPIEWVANYMNLFNEPSRTCILKTLPIEHRIAMLTTVTNWSFFTGDVDRLQAALVNTTPLDDVAALLGALDSNNYELFWKVYDEIDGNSSDVFIAGLSMFLLNHSPPAETLLGDWPDNRPTYTKHLLMNKTSFDGNFSSFERVGGKVKISTLNASEGAPHIALCDPFEYVRLEFGENFQMQNIESGKRIQAGDDLVVPAFFAYWILNRQATISNWRAFRIMINSFAAVLTLGSSTAITPGIIIALGFNGADISLALSSDYVHSNWDEETVAYFDACEMIIGLGDCVVGLSSLAKYGYSRAKLKQNILDKRTDPAQFSEFRKAINNAYEKFQALGPSRTNPGQRALLENFHREASMNVNLVQHGRTIPGVDATLDVRQGHMAFIEPASPPPGAGSVPGQSWRFADISPSGPTDVVLSNVRWQDNFYDEVADGPITETIYRIDNVAVRGADGATESKNLELIRSTKSGDVFVKETDNFVDDLIDGLKAEDGWTSGAKTTLRQDLSSNSFLSFIKGLSNSKRIEILQAWKILSGRKQLLRTSQDALEAVTLIRKNPLFATFGLTDEIIGKIKGWGFGVEEGASYSAIITDLDRLLTNCHVNSIHIANFNKITEVLTNGTNSSIKGVHWIIQDLAGDISTFNSKTIHLEFPVPNARPTQGNSYIDVYCVDCYDNGMVLLVEYKYGPTSVTKETIIKQFIERDLFNPNITSINQMQWRLKGTGMTKSQLNAWLKTTECREAIENLGLEKLSSLLDDPSILQLTELQATDKLIDFLNVNQNFNKIFKLQ